MDIALFYCYFTLGFRIYVYSRRNLKCLLEIKEEKMKRFLLIFVIIAMCIFVLFAGRETFIESESVLKYIDKK